METEILNYIKENSISNIEIFNKYIDIIEDLNNITILNHNNIPELIKTIIKQQCDGHLEEIKDYYDEFKELFNNNKQRFIESMEETLQLFCNKENICCFCGSELAFGTYSEDRGEYLGCPCSERMYIKHCSNNCF